MAYHSSLRNEADMYEWIQKDLNIGEVNKARHKTLCEIKINLSTHWTKKTKHIFENTKKSLEAYLDKLLREITSGKQCGTELSGYQEGTK